MNGKHTRQTLTTWLSRRLPYWQTLEEKIQQKSNDPDDAREVLIGFRSLVADLSLAQRNAPDSRITDYLQGLFLRSQEVIYRPPGNLWLPLRDLYNVEIPYLMRQMGNTLFSTLLLFTLSILAGWMLVSHYPDLATLFASPEMINNVQSGQLWTDGLLNIAPSSVISLGIITNNITVSLFAFALGALYGLGTLYLITLNGLMLGGIFAFTAHYQMATRLFEFIIGHGPVELSVIIIASAMGLLLGEALIRPGNRNRLQAFQETTLNAGKVLLAAIPFLILAGMIEGFVSPDPRFAMRERVLIGTSSGILFWLIMLHGLPGNRNRQTPSTL